MIRRSLATRIDAAEAKGIHMDLCDLGIPPRIVNDTADRLGVLELDANGRADAGETLQLQRAILYALKKTIEIRYYESKARQFIPINNEVPSGADAFTWNVFDLAGTANIVDAMSQDLPTVQLIAAELIQAIKSLGNGYYWSIQQLRATLSGIPLDARLGQAAKTCVERAIDYIACLGIPLANLPGIAKNANVPLVSGLTGTWSSATAAQILQDLNTIANYAMVSTKGAYNVNTLLLPPAQFAKIQSTPWSTTGSPDTILQVFLKNQTNVKNVDYWQPLELANAANNGPRAIVYDRSPQTVELFVPQEFEQLPPQPRDLRFFVPCHARIGGVTVYQPLAMAYADGI